MLVVGVDSVQKPVRYPFHVTIQPQLTAVHTREIHLRFDVLIHIPVSLWEKLVARGCYLWLKAPVVAEAQQPVNNATRNLELDLLYMRAVVELLSVLVLEISGAEQRRLS